MSFQQTARQSNITSAFFKASLKKVAALSLLAVALTGCSQESTQTNSAFKQEVVEEIDVLKAGMCFDDASSEDTITDEQQNTSVTSIPIIQCNQPHDNEVYHVYELPNAKAYKETDELLESMFVNCEAAFTDYVGLSYQESFYEMSFLTPTVESWQEGDREVVCYAFHPEADKLAKSLKNINT